MILRSSIRTHPCVSTISCKPIPNLTIRTPHITLQVRHATLLRRPKRPYQFTQLVTLSDGSTFTHRTTSPQAVYKSVKDVRNAPMWNPSSERLNNIEEDEAGRLARFRERFGRGWDADSVLDSQATQARDEDADQESAQQDSLLDLISGFSSGGRGSEASEKYTAKTQKMGSGSPPSKKKK